MRRYRLSQILIYCHINSAFRKTLALPKTKISNFETGPSRVLLEINPKLHKLDVFRG